MTSSGCRPFYQISLQRGLSTCSDYSCCIVKMKIFPLCLGIQRMLFSAVLFCKLAGHLIASAGVFLSLWWAPGGRGMCPFQLVPSGEWVKVNNAVHSCTNTHQPSAGLEMILVFSWNSFYVVKWFPFFVLETSQMLTVQALIKPSVLILDWFDRAGLNKPCSSFVWFCGCKESPALLEEVKSAGHWVRSKHVSGWFCISTYNSTNVVILNSLQDWSVVVNILHFW